VIIWRLVSPRIEAPFLSDFRHIHVLVKGGLLIILADVRSTCSSNMESSVLGKVNWLRKFFLTLREICK
jgi:hypothetical protein